jgi:hypothetical protein
MSANNPGLSLENIEKSFALASTLFPKEEWVLKEPTIWVAKSRLPEEYRERDKWEREMSQVHILTSWGSAAYFLPEKKNESKTKIYADMVITGEITELKTVSGNRLTLGTDFRQDKQGATLAHCLTLNLTKGRPQIVFSPKFATFTYFSCRFIALYSLHKLYLTRRMYETRHITERRKD